MPAPAAPPAVLDLPPEFAAALDGRGLRVRHPRTGQEFDLTPADPGGPAGETGDVVTEVAGEIDDGPPPGWMPPVVDATADPGAVPIPGVCTDSPPEAWEAWNAAQTLRLKALLRRHGFPEHHADPPADAAGPPGEVSAEVPGEGMVA